MKGDPKPTTQELFDVLTEVLNGNDLIFDAVFGSDKPPLGEKFIIVEPSKGQRQILTVAYDGVVAYCHENAVVAALLSWSKKLPADFTNYKFTFNKARQCVDYWLHSSPVVDLDTIYPVLQKSSPGLTFHRLDFDMKEEPTPLFDDILSRVETNKAALRAFIGMIFDKTAPRQYYLWLHGKGGDGKGTLSRMLRRFLGDAYVVLSDDKNQHNQFFTSRLLGKRLGVFPDCDNRDIVKSGMFMSITGGDPVFIERKGKDGFTAEIETLCMFLSNKLPNISGAHSDLRRAVICQMTPRQDKEQDPTYEARLWEERAGIMHKCWSEWQDMNAKYGHLNVDIEAAGDLAEENETVFEEIFERHFCLADSELSATEIYAALREDRISNSLIHDFYAWLERSKGVTPSRSRVNGRRKKVFPGVGLRVVGSGKSEPAKVITPQF